jgi:hypothetical protein
VILLHVGLEDSLIVEDEAALLAAVALLLRILRAHTWPHFVSNEILTVLGSIPASFDTVESERRADEAVLNKVLKI